MAEDDGFGPPLRGGGRGGRAKGTSPAKDRSEDDFGPVVRGRPRRRWGRKAGKLVLIGLLVLSLAAVGTGSALALYTNAQIDRIDVDGLQRGGAPLNVLLVGSDSREGLSPEQRRDWRTGTAAGNRTDTILLLSVAGGQAAMLSFPRDLYVRNCDGAERRINAAYSAGGPSCLVDTVTQLSGIPVHHYMEIDFAGFVQIVDAVGGVSIYLEEPIDDPLAGLDLDAGCQRLGGGQALGYVRTRVGPGGDLGRVARQQRFVRELAKEVAEPSTLLNVPRLFDVAGSSADALLADSRFGLVEMARLGRAARSLAGGATETYTVPATPATVGGAAVLALDQAEAEELFARFRDGSVLARQPDLRPQDVSVVVLNGAGVSGLAGEGRDHLERAGFTVTDVGNTDPVQRTVVRYISGQEAAATLVAERLPQAVTEQVGDGPPVVVALGPDADFDEPAPPEPDEPAEPAEDEPAADDAIGAGPPPEDC